MDTTSKLETVYKAGTNPSDMAPFVFKNGFRLSDNDTFFMMNYELVNCTQFTKQFMPIVSEEHAYAQVYKNIKAATLFPVKSELPLPSAFAYAESKISVASYVEKMEARTLVITTRERMKPINYYFNGLRNAQSKWIQFAVFDENNLYNDTGFALLEQLLDLEEYTFVIIDYDIESSKNPDDLKENLKGIDSILGRVSVKCKKENRSLFVSSLYGMRKKYTLENGETRLVDFSKKVPVIIADKEYPKNIYRLEYGTLYDFALSLYKNIKEEETFPSLIQGQKKGFSLLGLFRKK